MSAGERRAFRLSLRRRAAVDVDDELRFHLDMRASDLIAHGWEPAAARAEARRQFGDLEDARNFCRRTDQRRETRVMRTEWFAAVFTDLRFAARTLRKAPGFTIVAALTLALGVGANTAIFSVVRGILLRPLPFTRPSELVMVPGLYEGRRASASPANIADWRTMNHSFTGMAELGGHSAVITGNGEPERLRGYDVGGDFFGILGVKAIAGRSTFTAEESAWKGAPAVLIAESLWRSRFGGDSTLVGSMITLDNQRYRVAGIIPSVSAWPTGTVVWFPFSMDPKELPGSRGAIYLNAIARLKPGVTVEAAAADMRAIGARLEKQYPQDNTGMGADAVALHEWITGDLKQPLFVLLGGVAFVLLIACANVANLTLVRGVAREAELAVRIALGAPRRRLVRQLLTESIVLASIGGAAGIAIAFAGTRLLVRLAPATIPRLAAVHVDAQVLAFAIAVTMITGLVFGLIPARQLLQRDVSKTLREGGRAGARVGGNRARRALVVAEVAMSVALLAGAGLLMRSFSRLMNVDPGFRTESSISYSLSLPPAKYSQDQVRLFTSDMLDRVEAIPGVLSAGAALGMPLTTFSWTFSFAVNGRPAATPGHEPSAQVRVATPDYFNAMGIPVKRGRGFTAADRAGSQRVLVLTESAAKQFFPGEDPIGKHVQFGWGRGGGALEGDVVGVVGDVKQISLARASEPQFYAVFDQWPVTSYSVVMHTSRDPQLVMADARRIIHQIDPALAISQVKQLDQVVAESVAQPRFYMLLLAMFAAVAILLAAIGIYGVIAYLVGQRVREIGIRIALGASATRVIRLVVREGILMAGTGLVIGLVAAIGLTRMMKNLLFDVTPGDPVTYLGATIALSVVALAASCVPALRAARVDPARTMRGD